VGWFVKIYFAKISLRVEKSSLQMELTAKRAYNEIARNQEIKGDSIHSFQIRGTASETLQKSRRKDAKKIRYKYHAGTSRRYGVDWP
jgi:hypothetical protein